MKKLFCIGILLLITIFGTYLAVVPYTYNNRIKDPTSDLIFEDAPSIEEANLTFDYSILQEADQSLLGRINLNLQLDESNTCKKALLPFYGTLNNEISNYHSRFGKNVEIKVDGQDSNYIVSYGALKEDNELLNYNYSEIKDKLYTSLEDEGQYYVYTFHFNNGRIGLDHWVLDKYPFLISNFKVVSKLSKKEKEKLKNTKYENHALLEPTADTAYIISKIDIDDYLTDVEEKIEIQGTVEFYKYFLKEYSNIDLDYAIPVAQNEYNKLFENVGFHDINFNDLINHERLMVYEFELPLEAITLDIAYNHIVGKDSRYDNPQFELDFKYNTKNYKSTKRFNVRYILDEKNKFINFTILDLEKTENGYELHTTSIPEETKIFFSASETLVKSLNTFKIELAGFSKYILIPVLFCVLFIFIGVNLLNHNFLLTKRSVKEWSVLFKKKLLNHIPEILTIYLLSFKFYTLYVGDSSFNLINSILVMVFLLSCFIYFVCKTMNSVNYFKLALYSILACITGLLVQDVAFVMLIALGACFLEKGPKPYLKAMYLGIIFFSIQTILLAAYEVIPNPTFFVWKDEEIKYYRYALGFSYPNTVSLFLFVGCLCYILYNKPTWLARGIMVGLTAGTYIVTQSRTGCICVAFLLILDVLSDFVPIKGKWRYICAIAFPLLTIFTILLSRSYGREWINKVNDLLSGRIWIFNSYAQDNYLSFLGMPLDTRGPIDNLYLNVLILQGLPCYLIYLIIYTIASYKAIKSNHPKIFIGLLVYFIYSLFEATLMSYSCAIFVALLFITTLGDKYNMDGSLIKRKPRQRRRYLYITKSPEGLKIDSTATNIILVLGKENKEEVLDNATILYVTKISIWKKISELYKNYDPDEIHLFAPTRYVSFVVLFNVFKGDLIVHTEKDVKMKGKLYKKAAQVVEG